MSEHSVRLCYLSILTAYVTGTVILPSSGWTEQGTEQMGGSEAMYATSGIDIERGEETLRFQRAITENTLEAATANSRSSAARSGLYLLCLNPLPLHVEALQY